MFSKNRLFEHTNSSLSSKFIRTINFFKNINYKINKLNTYIYHDYSPFLKNYNYKNFKINTFFKKSFYIFTNFGILSHSKTINPHYTFSTFLIKNSLHGSTKVLSINNIFKNYYTVLNFVYNLYYYELKVLTFGNTFFKNEIYSLN